MNKFDRIVSTLVLLQSKKIIKAMDISERFGISLRTVYRDINSLKTAGIPIIGDPGIGYSLVDGFRLPPLMFNEGEATALLTAEKFIGRLTDQETLGYYSSAMMKIKAILRSSEKQALSELDDSIVITENNNWDNKTHLQNLFKSIASKKKVNIHYKKLDGSSSVRKVEAIGCYHQFNNWYLVAFCHKANDYRTFKLNRIEKLELLEDNFDTEHLSLQNYIDNQKESWKEEQQFHSIEIAFYESFVNFAESRKYYFGFVEQKQIEDAVHMKFLNSSIEIMARWLLQFGNQATVIAPDILKDRLKTLSSQLYQHYS